MSDDIMRVDTQGHDPYMQLDLLAQAKAANLLPDNVLDRLTRLVFANAGLYAGGTTDARADVPKGTCTANHPKPATAERMEGAGLPVSDMTRRLSIADYLRGRTLPGYTDPAYARRAFGKKLRRHTRRHTDTSLRASTVADTPRTGTWRRTGRCSTRYSKSSATGRGRR